MENKTRELLIEEIRSATLEYLKHGEKTATAEIIGKKLNVSRSVISKYLNEMSKNGQLIKVLSRPVLFLEKQAINLEIGVPLVQEEFLSVAELDACLAKCRKNGKDFDNVIGNDGSLKEVIRRLKAAVKYPAVNGLAVFIQGREGSGKSFLITCLGEYLQEKVQFIHCMHKKEEMHEILFGNERETGCLQNLDREILVLCDAEYLPVEEQDEIAIFLENDYQFRKNGKLYKSDVRLLFSTSSVSEKEFTDRFLNAIPMRIDVPELSERPLKEKEQLVQFFFRREEIKLQREICLSNLVYHVLLKHEYIQNINGLRDTIQTVCATANVDRENSKDIVSIYTKHLPEALLSEIQNTVYEEKKILSLKEFSQNSQKDVVIEAYEAIRESFKQMKQREVSVNDFLKYALKAMNQCSDHIIFEKRPDNKRRDSVRQIVRNIAAVIQDKLNVVIQGSCIEVLAALAYKKMYLDTNQQKWEEENNQDIEEILDFLRDEFPEETRISERLMELLDKVLDLNECGMDTIFLVLNLYFYKPGEYRKKTMGLIVAHGYATASSIADCVNRLLESYVFDAIDMPLDVEACEIAEHVQKYIREYAMADNLILLVDIGSLEEMVKELQFQGTMQLGIVNNVSTRTALDIGNRIVCYENMEEILKESCKNSSCTYRILVGQKKKDAILFTTEAGEHATERVLRLFEKSIPKRIDVKLIACDKDVILLEKDRNPILQEYNPLFIVSTMENQGAEVPQVLLEDVVAFQDFDMLKQILRRYFNEKELEVFNQNLLTNFSLENVIENITILNPNVLMDFIKQAIRNLEYQYHLNLNGKTQVALYIHTCCMVERLVTKVYCDTHFGLENVIEKQKEFIRIFKNSFREVEEHYHIEIPVGEIAYIYDYIQNGNQKGMKNE